MKPIDRRVTRITSEEISSELSSWDLPSVDRPASTNAFARKSHVASAPYEEDEEIVAERLTLSELEEIRAAARREAYDEGYKEGAAKGLVDGLDEGQKKGREQGYEEGFASGRGDVEALQKTLASMILQQEKPVAEIYDNLERQLLNMVVDLSRAVVGRTAAVDQQVVCRMVKEMLDQIPVPHEDLKLHVHPSSVDIVQSMAVAARESWQVVPDPSVEVGGCFAQTLNTFADNTLETRFNQALDQFNQHRLHKDDGDE